MTRALIIGVASDSGAYLARLLQARGQQVWGAVAGPGTDLGALDDLGVRADIALLEYNDLGGLLDEARADHIYDLRAGVGGDPDAVVEGCRRLLDAPRSLSSRVFIGGSGEVFGDTGGNLATAASPFAPQTAMGLATLGIVDLVKRSRLADARFIVTGFLFDHASRFGPRPSRALEIIAAAHALSTGQAKSMTIEDADDERDWGWTPEYVDAMRRMLELPEPRDQVIATGTRMTVRAFASHALDYFRVDGDRLSVTPDRSRPARTSLGDPAALVRDTGWRAYTHGRDLVDTLCEGYVATLGAS